MGIDRHELEHRNWRPSASKFKTELDHELVEQLDTSIVPDAGDHSAPSLNHKREKIEQRLMRHEGEGIAENANGTSK